VDSVLKAGTRLAVRASGLKTDTEVRAKIVLVLA
jgi:hypothetical protein